MHPLQISFIKIPSRNARLIRDHHQPETYFLNILQNWTNSVVEMQFLWMRWIVAGGYQCTIAIKKKNTKVHISPSPPLIAHTRHANSYSSISQQKSVTNTCKFRA